MSRSGYTEDSDNNWDLIRWRGAVLSATRGKRGQAFLRDLLAALEAMPERELVANEFQADGSFCTLGVIGDARGVNLDEIDVFDYDELSSTFGVASALVREIMYENDDFWIPSNNDETAKRRARWLYMHNWVKSRIKEEADKQVAPQD
jgi:hypothetical protein